MTFKSYGASFVPSRWYMFLLASWQKSVKLHIRHIWVMLFFLHWDTAAQSYSEWAGGFFSCIPSYKTLPPNVTLPTAACLVFLTKSSLSQGGTNCRKTDTLKPNHQILLWHGNYFFLRRFQGSKKQKPQKKTLHLKVDFPVFSLAPFFFRSAWIYVSMCAHTCNRNLEPSLDLCLYFMTVSPLWMFYSSRPLSLFRMERHPTHSRLPFRVAIFSLTLNPPFSLLWGLNTTTSAGFPPTLS